MQVNSKNGDRPCNPGWNNSAITAYLPVEPGDLEKLGRWVPMKEMELLIEICERAQRDPDLARPALILRSAYAEKVARMLDQDPFPILTRKARSIAPKIPVSAIECPLAE